MVYVVTEQREGERGREGTWMKRERERGRGMKTDIERGTEREREGER